MEAGNCMQTDADGPITTLPIEVVANHLFKFFDFKYWIEYLIPVCKKWQLAAVQSQLVKLICLDLSKMETILNAQYMVSHYRIAALMLKQAGTSVYHLADIINASPMLKTVYFLPPCTSFTTFSFNEGLLPIVGTQPHDPKIYCNHVTTVGVPHEHQSLLCLFPNVEYISIGGDTSNWHGIEFSSARVKDIEISTEIDDNDSACHLVKKLKLNFPNLTKLYHTIYSLAEEISWNEFITAAKELGVEVNIRPFYHGDITKSSDLNNISRHLPWLHNESLASNLESAIDWSASIQKQQLEQYYRDKTLPFWMSVKFEIDNLENGTEIAVETLKHALSHQLSSFSELAFISSCADVLSKLSLQRIAAEVGRDKLRIMLNGRFKNIETVLRHLILRYDALVSYLDLLGFQDLMDTEALKELQIDILFHWNIKRNFDILPAIQEIDAIFKQRQVEGLGALIVQAFIFRQFSCQCFSDVSSLVQTFNIDVNQFYDGKGNTLLSFGIEEGYYTMIEEAIKLGIDLNKPDKNGLTPLVKAIQHNYQAAVEILLRKGADPNIAGDASRLPLHLALKKSDEDSFRIMNTLLSFGADINKPYFDKKDGRTLFPLTVAVAKGPNNVEKVKQLILRGADPKITDEAGNTLLHTLLGSTDERKELLSLLVKYINIDHPNKLGRTPLHQAVMEGSDLIGDAIALGADVNRVDMFGRTPLMLAMAVSCYENSLHPLLITNKINIKARDKIGQSFVSYILSNSLWSDMQTLFKSKIDLYLTIYGTSSDTLTGEDIIEACKFYFNVDDNLQFIIDECKSILSHSKSLKKAFKIITCHVTLTKFVVEQVGLDVNHSDILGNTLLSSMKVNGEESIQVFEYLVNKGAKLDWKSSERALLLHEAFKAPLLQRKSFQKMKLLMKYGALVTEPNKNGHL